MTATCSTNQCEQPLKMPLTRLGWPRSDRALYGDSGTLGPFGCIGLSACEVRPQVYPSRVQARPLLILKTPQHS
jgi:hypothetical protein